MSGPVAQLGARFHGMEEVIGSIPIRSTNKSITCRLLLPVWHHWHQIFQIAEPDTGWKS